MSELEKFYPHIPTSDEETPPYVKAIIKVLSRIAKGEFKDGKLDAVRRMAEEFDTSPNTAAKITRWLIHARIAYAEKGRRARLVSPEKAPKKTKAILMKHFKIELETLLEKVLEFKEGQALVHKVMADILERQSKEED